MTSVSTDRRQGVNSGAAIKIPVRAATTANITLSGLQTIDGVVLAADDRVLVKNQTDQTENGIYYADTGDWTRTEDFDGYFDVVKGTLVYATEGTVGASLAFAVTSASNPTFGTTNITFGLAGLLYTPIYTGDGTVGAPSHSFLNDTDSGMYRIGANNIALGVAGAKVLDISADGLGVTGQIFASNGTVALPGIAFGSEPDCGMYRIGANNVGVSIAGAKMMDLSTSITQFFTAADSTTTANFTNSHATNPGGIGLIYSVADPNGTGNPFWVCYAGAGATERATLRSNGGLANFSANNVNLSDERVKKDVQPAPSYYDSLRRFEFVTYLYKDQTDEERNLGVIAQQIEEVCPELIDNSGWGKREVQAVVDGEPQFTLAPLLDKNDQPRMEQQKTGVLDAEGRAITREVPVLTKVPLMVENPAFDPDGKGPLKAIYETDLMYAVARALQETIEHLEALKAEFAAYRAAHP